ncbi:hypothetical protein [Providencia hangzhouensis]
MKPDTNSGCLVAYPSPNTLSIAYLASISHSWAVLVACVANVSALTIVISVIVLPHLAALMPHLNSCRTFAAPLFR